jgi:hypothetical protein
MKDLGGCIAVIAVDRGWASSQRIRAEDNGACRHVL